VKKIALYRTPLAAKDGSLDVPATNFSGFKPVALLARNYKNFAANLQASSHKGCRILSERVSRRNALPQWQRGGRKASMALALQVVAPTASVSSTLRVRFPFSPRL
jgi:hypothetical protein